MQGSEDARSFELIESLARAKRELARELEANLTQLREVLKESERIARQLEAVLQETQAPLEPAPGRGGRRDGGDAREGPELTGTLGQLLEPIVRGGGRHPRRFWLPRPTGDGKGTAARGPKK